jgi:glucokinase
MSVDGAGGDVVLAVDVGGTKIRVALVDEDGRVRAAAQRPTPKRDAPAVLDVVTALADQLSGPGARACGVAAAGVLDVDTGTVVAATDALPGWVGTPLRAELATRLGLPVAVDRRTPRR